MNKFEQLIEYVINDETDKARELFHEIVVDKSRQIYEDIMAEEADEDLDEDKDEDLDESADEDLDEGMGGDASDDLIDEIEADEEKDMSMEGEEDLEGEDDGGEEEGEEDFEVGGEEEAATKDDILDIKDKLDELMADFEALMGSEEAEHGDDMGDGNDFGDEEGGDAIEMDDTEEMMPMAEAVNLKAAPKPVTGEEGSVNKKSTVAANAGAKGPIGSTVKPVHTGGEGGGKHDAAGAYSNQTKELIGKVGNTPAQGTQKPTPATKPTLGQAAGVNNKSIVPGKHN